jgi:hypothetical protein
MLAVPFLEFILSWAEGTISSKRGDKEMVIHWWMENMPLFNATTQDFEIRSNTDLNTAIHGFDVSFETLAAASPRDDIVKESNE